MYVKEYECFTTTHEIHILMNTSEQIIHRLQMIEEEFSHHTNSRRRWMNVFIVVGYFKETYNLKIPQLE